MTAILHPFDIAEAREAERLATSLQQGGETTLRDASKALAEAERQYRMALAQTIVKLHAEGAAWTVCQDLARGDNTVADLRYARDVAKGILDAAEQAAWRHSADRKALGRFTEWSMRIDMRGDPEQPNWTREPVIGARRAA